MLSFVDRGLGMGWSLVQGVLPCIKKLIKKQEMEARAHKGCRATDKSLVFDCTLLHTVQIAQAGAAGEMYNVSVGCST
jgi:hypothetical protein